MLEIYNETILDLLCSNHGGSGKLDVRQTAEGNQVVGLSEIPVSAYECVVLPFFHSLYVFFNTILLPDKIDGASEGAHEARAGEPRGGVPRYERALVPLALHHHNSMPGEEQNRQLCHIRYLSDEEQRFHRTKKVNLLKFQ